jgi:cellulose synthase/poly-beta-1,6-N-acetylglucosamine synthase-like glycosyltransferase
MSKTAAGTARVPTASVVIASYAGERWSYLQDAVASVLAQTHAALEIVVVVDHNPDLLVQARRALPAALVIPNTGVRGASGARNTGVAVCHGDVLAFLDDDARASAEWLAALLPHFADPDVVGVGGRVDPIWATSRPGWFPPEFDWVVGGSYRGMPRTAEPVRNVWSNNMAIRRTVFDAAGGFREKFGKVGSRSRPEDTDLCLRATAGGRGIWVYEPAGIAGHQVPPERTTVRYFLRRCFHEGRGKAGLSALNGAADSTSTERRYARNVLPQGIARGLAEAARGDWTGALRSAAIVAGFGTAAAGYLTGVLAGRIEGRLPGDSGIEVPA